MIFEKTVAYEMAKYRSPYLQISDSFRVWSSIYPFRCEGRRMTIVSPFSDHTSLYPSKLFSFLYLGSYDQASSTAQIKDLNIKCVVNATVECKNRFSHLEYYNLGWEDAMDQPLTRVEEAYQFIGRKTR